LLVDVVDWFPGAGDVFGFLPTGAVDDGTLNLRAAGILRSAAHGLTANTMFSEEPSVRVKLSGTGQPNSSGVSDGFGYYRTGGNYAFSLLGSTLQTVGGTALSIGEMLARHRHRGAFIADSCFCSQLQFGDPLTYFPFSPQFSDPATVPTEEWRRVGGAVGFGERSHGSTSTGAVGEGTSSSDGEEGGNSRGTT
jgi:hypothetical protein